MIAHVVLFQPRPDLTDEARRALLDAVRAAASSIPSVRRFYVGRRLRHGLPGYEQAMHDDFQFAAIVEFGDVEGLKDYLAHPAHERLGHHFLQSSLKALAYDYEVVDAAAAHLTLD